MVLGVTLIAAKGMSGVRFYGQARPAAQDFFHG
jgi:hypothetical protein